ncbi:histidine kinase, partial [Streptomyces seoulensis]
GLQAAVEPAPRRPPPAPPDPRGPVRTPAPASPGTTALPTRTRQASLAPELRADPPPADDTPLGAADPEEMRALFAAFQRGLSDGRNGVPAHDNAHEGTDTDDVR